MKKLLVILCIFSFGYSFSQIPAGYYNNAAGKHCAALKTALKNIISSAVNPRSYSALFPQYIISDIKPRTVGTGSANVIYDIYSAKPGGVDAYQFTPGPVASGGQQDNGTLGTAEGQLYNREHSVPQSWFSGNTGNSGPATDYFIVYPTDKFVNGKRGDLPYSLVGTATKTFTNGTKTGSSAFAGITGTAFEPIDSFKGDVARAFLYFVTMYEDNIPTWSANATAVQTFDNSTFPSVKIPYLKLMLSWHHLDPVSQKEIDRNNAAYTYQHNRNPFIDHPEYVDSVWNASCAGLSSLPVDIWAFTGRLNDNKIQLNWEVGNEINLQKYVVERSVNGTEFYAISEIKATGKSAYHYTDDAHELRGRRVYYRLKNIDNNGTFKYSDVFSIHIPLNVQFALYPNPAKDFIQLQVNNNTNQTASVVVSDTRGKVCLQKEINIVNGFATINTSGLPSGTYLVKMNIAGESYMQKLVIVK